MGWLDRIVLASLPLVPRPVMRRLSSRYIAGERVEDALARLRSLASEGYGGILDILGEDVADADAARGALGEYLEAARALEREGLDAYVSVKPTHFGLRHSAALAEELYSELAELCRSSGRMVRVEMEDHTTTDATLELFASLRARYDNVGIVLQSRLHRTPADVDGLPKGPVDVRLVKGIYLEPASIAHTDAQAIRNAFVECGERILDRGHVLAMATHDEHMAARMLRSVRDRGVEHSRTYFEVLLGVQEPLWRRWRGAGTPVRVYVPFGPEWRAYSQRRLRHNPEILRHVMRATLRRR